MLTRKILKDLNLWHLFLHKYQWDLEMEETNEKDIFDMIFTTMKYFNIFSFADLYPEYRREYIHFFTQALKIKKASEMKIFLDEMISEQHYLRINLKLLWDAILILLTNVPETGFCYSQ